MLPAMLSVLVLATGAPAPEPSVAPVGGEELVQTTGRDLAVTAAAAVAWIGTETLFKSSLAPLHCRWCDRSEGGSDTLNGVDAWGRGLRARSVLGQQRADVASSVIDYGALPLALLCVEAGVLHGNLALGRAREDALDIVEAVALAGVLNQGVKFAVGRERPFVHVLPTSARASTPQPNDNNLSFYSGHSSVAFSLVVSAGTVASLRGYDGAGWIWAVGVPLAAAVPVLRMVADKHYLSDVLVGSVMGAGMGFAVPFFLHPRKRTSPLLDVHVSVGPGGVVLTWVG